MRLPFVIAVCSRKNLSEMQSRRREKLIKGSRAYREYLARSRRLSKHSPDHRGRTVGPYAFAPNRVKLTNPEICLLVEVGEALDGGSGKPYQQIFLEIQAWERAHRSVIASARDQAKNREWLT